MQKDSAADLELNLKKKARRRLVGAITLVLLLAILLPWLLKDRAQIAQEDEIKITMAGESEPPSVEPSAKVEPSDFDSNIVPADASKASEVVALPNQTPPAEIENSAPSVEDTETKTAESKPETTKSDESDIKEKTNDAASKPIPAQSIAKEVPDSKGVFFVQVGVFSDPNNVKNLQSKLKDLGYQSKTEKVNTPKGEKIRLRSHAFSSRNEAAIALANIKEAGLTGMVVSQ